MIIRTQLRNFPAKNIQLYITPHSTYRKIFLAKKLKGEYDNDMETEEDETQIDDKPSVTLTHDGFDINLIRDSFSWDHPNVALLFGTLGVYGFATFEIAAILGITTAELEQRMAENPAIKENYENGPHLANLEVSRRLYLSAVEKGNVSAQTFWLKKRMPEVYGDSITVKGDPNSPVILTVEHVLKTISGKSGAIPKDDKKFEVLDFVKDEHGNYTGTSELLERPNVAAE